MAEAEARLAEVREAAKEAAAEAAAAKQAEAAVRKEQSAVVKEAEKAEREVRGSRALLACWWTAAVCRLLLL